MPSLSKRSSFWTAATVAAIALWASGSPAMVYPIYVAEWHLEPIVITSIFAVYPISLVVILIVFGSVSDFIGRRATMLAGVGTMAVGILLFAIAPDVGWVFAGRALQGIGVGLAMSPASAAMVEFNPSGNSARASSINTAATALGLALATIVGGALVQFAPFPGHLNYWALFVITISVLILVTFLPRGDAGSGVNERWRPRGIRVPRGLGAVFVTSAIAITAGFAMGALLLSLGSEIAKDLLKTQNAFVAGTVISLSAVAIGVAAILARRFEPRTAIAVGGLATAAGMGLIVVSDVAASLPVFLVASIVSGTGYGLLFLGGLGLTNRFAPAHHRAQTLSAVYLVAYLAQGLVAVAVGLSATALGLAPAVAIWAPIIAGICIVATLLAVVVGRKPREALA
jgi:MFS family permease